ncbi:MAG: class I SAM-dependent methyltransferase [Cyclobacteriaceae bacterium]
MEDQKIYYHCLHCKLIFLDKQFLPSPAQEKTRYDQHQNTADDKGYVSFLEQLITPASAYLKPGMRALDFGCGPEPVLASLLEERFSLSCEVYDPYYFPQLPEGKYDCIFATETFEHFFQPALELEKLSQWLMKDAYLFMMTSRWHSLQHFKNWWYRRDITHVSFYHRKSMEFIAASYGFNVLYDDQKSICLLQKT